MNFEQEYSRVDQELRIKRSVIGCILSITLVPAGSILDYFVYPNLLEEFFLIRVLCSFITLCFLALHYTNFGKKFIPYITFFWLSLIQIAICYMIFVTDQHLSTYYASLNLVILGTSVLLIISVAEVSLFCLFTIIAYTVVALNFPLSNFETFYNNIYFIVLTSIISITAAHFNAKSRLEEFRLNYNLKEINYKLTNIKAQLIHSEKINALGVMSAGILHEINNPLNYTITAATLLKRDEKIRADENLSDIVSDITEGMTRIKNIVSDLHNFSHPEEMSKIGQCSVASIIESALRFTSEDTRNLQKTINIPDDLMVTVSKTHIVQVMINLISNANKAIVKTDRKGILTISAEVQGDGVVMSVSDNGIGMDKETLARVFDPFFTTSAVGSGMGMGLSVSYMIIKNHGGELRATSVVGEGTTFSFNLLI